LVLQVYPENAALSTELSSPPTKSHGFVSQKIATSNLINYLLTKGSIKLQGEMPSTSAWMLLLLVNTRHLQSKDCNFSIQTYCQHHKVISIAIYNVQYNECYLEQIQIWNKFHCPAMPPCVPRPVHNAFQWVRSQQCQVMSKSISECCRRWGAGTREGRADNKTWHFSTNPHRGVTATFSPPQQWHSVNWLAILDTNCSLNFSRFLLHS